MEELRLRILLDEMGVPKVIAFNHGEYNAPVGMVNVGDISRIADKLKYIEEKGTISFLQKPVSEE